MTGTPPGDAGEPTTAPPGDAREPATALPEDAGAPMSGPTTAGADAAPEVPPRPRRRRARLGLPAQILSIAGVVVSLVLVLAVWWARGLTVNSVDSIASSMDQGLALAGVAANRAADQVDSVAGGLDTLATKAADVAASPNATADDLQGLTARLSSVADRYREFRAGYGDLREKAVSTIDTLTRLDRFVPGVSVPQGPIDALAALDERVRGLDSTISSLVGAVDRAGSVSSTAGSVATQAAAASATLTQASTSVRSISDSTDSLRTDVSNLRSGVTLLLTIVAIVLTILLAYIALLHVALWTVGRGWRRSG
jgi:methyl-accepting chemotaxis protein